MVVVWKETVFGFLPKLIVFEHRLLKEGASIVFKQRLMEAGRVQWGMADGASPSLSFYSLNWRSIQFCFLSNIDICLWSYV